VDSTSNIKKNQNLMSFESFFHQIGEISFPMASTCYKWWTAGMSSNTWLCI
jgi:hypothetical protein